MHACICVVAIGVGKGKLVLGMYSFELMCAKRFL